MTGADGGSMAEYYSDPADEDGDEPTAFRMGPENRQIALEVAGRVHAGLLIGFDARTAEANAEHTVELAKRYEQYLTTGT